MKSRDNNDNVIITKSAFSAHSDLTAVYSTACRVYNIINYGRYAVKPYTRMQNHRETKEIPFYFKIGYQLPAALPPTCRVGVVERPRSTSWNMGILRCLVVEGLPICKLLIYPSPAGERFCMCQLI